MSTDDLKRAAAERALAYVRPGMKLGLGTGSTAAHFVDLLAQRVKAGLDVVGVPTSEATKRQAEALGVPLTTLADCHLLDLTVDGADELDAELRLIKGGGGALLREKIVASASDRMIVIADASKRVARLGAFPLPIEVLPFGWQTTELHIIEQSEDAGAIGPVRQRLDKSGQPFVTDNGNFILDCAFGVIHEPEILADALNAIPGVVDHGLFIGICDTAILAGPAGIEIITHHADDES